jgi:type VI secretion system protein ImpK
MRLIDHFIELFAFVTAFLKKVEEQQPPFQQVQATVVRLLAKSETAVEAGRYSREEVDQARFALCAWVDEKVLNSPWREKHLWLREQLQRSYFGTTDAGEEFFQRLNALPIQEREVREVYYLCLCLGFTGLLCTTGDERQLEQLKIAALKSVSSTDGTLSLGPDDLLLHGLAGDSSAATVDKLGWFSLPLASCVVGPVLLFAVLFLIFRFTLAGIGEGMLNSITR